MTDAPLDSTSEEEARAVHRLGVAGIVGMFSLSVLFLLIGCVLPD